ncbi:MAG: 4-hydroxythreonine-4-phosphate dehydrogenase PdxA [Betaproteobacteria bacterium]|nr:4-hydroxythreonine-4-phosphate dehydrogenase PdxA [Betaproteobacteria bacterium]
MPLKPIALTAGEPAGIGPDLCLLVARKPPEVRLVVIADKRLLAERAAALGVSIVLKDYGSGDIAVAPGTLTVAHESLAGRVTPGKPDPANSRYVLRTLERAIRGCASREFSALVTAPVHKGVINDAGIPFTGHTEFLAEKTATRRVVMMLTGAGMRVALATTHLALKDVPAAITRESLEETLRIVERDLRQRFGLARPRILVAGLNPHAGESGHRGREEIEVIAPVLERLRGEGFDLRGPLPADTLFNPERLRDADCVLAMYHDQGLPVLKHASFGGGVNVTLGLPIIRTSVDHGTALELAGTGRIDCGSLLAAIDLARQLAEHRQGA